MYCLTILFLTILYTHHCSGSLFPMLLSFIPSCSSQALSFPPPPTLKTPTCSLDPNRTTNPRIKHSLKKRRQTRYTQTAPPSHVGYPPHLLLLPYVFFWQYGKGSLNKLTSSPASPTCHDSRPTGQNPNPEPYRRAPLSEKTRTTNKSPSSSPPCRYETNTCRPDAPY